MMSLNKRGTIGGTRLQELQACVCLHPKREAIPKVALFFSTWISFFSNRFKKGIFKKNTRTVLRKTILYCREKKIATWDLLSPLLFELEHLGNIPNGFGTFQLMANLQPDGGPIVPVINLGSHTNL